MTPHPQVVFFVAVLALGLETGRAWQPQKGVPFHHAATSVPPSTTNGGGSRGPKALQYQEEITSGTSSVNKSNRNDKSPSDVVQGSPQEETTLPPFFGEVQTASGWEDPTGNIIINNNNVKGNGEGDTTKDKVEEETQRLLAQEDALIATSAEEDSGSFDKTQVLAEYREEVFAVSRSSQ